jgi:acyl-CoA synthetase (AMP-forming)/AMP-acid ligase II
VADAGAEAIVRDAGELRDGPDLARHVTARPGDVAALFYTSGTTGSPKGVELTHRGLLGAFPRAALVPLLQARRDEAVVAQPVAHIMGFVACLGLACAGVPALFFERFRADAVLDAIERRRSTLFIGVPAMYRMLLDAGAEGRDLTSVRVWMSGADAMPPDLARRFQKLGATATLPGIGPVGEALFFEGYGMAELAGAVAVRVDTPGGISRHLLGDGLGVPVPGYRLRVVREDGRTARPGEVGELWVKGPGVTPGYWGNPDASDGLLTSDGWLRTGDLARRGALGTFTFAGRSKDVVKHGGYSVYALEVERVLDQHPAVAESAVLGLPDERMGEVPVAVVVLRAEQHASEDELIAFCRERLADYKCPRRIAFMKELPRTGSGKVQKGPLRERFS